MAYELNHWNNPRGSIANKYVNNDNAYISRGANIALYVLAQFDITPSQAKTMTILDYGCGTGRASAFLSLIFGKVIGFDPNVNCIKVAHEENAKSELKLPNLVLTTNIKDIPLCDIALSTNVIEHLDDSSQQVMISTIKRTVSGKSLIWYNPSLNARLKPYIVGAKWEDRMNSGKIQVDFFDIH